MTTAPTVASPPSTSTTALRILAAQGAQTGVISDFNKGSQIRTLSEAVGQVAEMQGIASEALAFQVMVYGCWSAFGITPITASYASVTLTFSVSQYGSTGTTTAPYDIAIPAGTIVQTSGGVQFATVAAATLASGAASIDVIATASEAGTSSNVNALTLTTLAASLGYPLYVTNTTAATGGSAAETPAQTMARFSAEVAKKGGGTPLGVASAAIGVSYGTETVKYATCYEPWLEEGTTEAGFTVFVDNGSGSASSGLTEAVFTTLSGSSSSDDDGYRPAGVPASVSAVVPVSYNVSVTGTLKDSGNTSTVSTAVSAAISAYESTLSFGDDVTLSALIGSIVNALTGYTSTLTIELLDSSGTQVSSITVGPKSRAILDSLTVVFS